ncbi:ABC transporter substrate-binding protein [Allopusillimonas soli]|uniref:ABC transporter substrate-binding protein n=1 Tax=Allopusillimonas soli TaxID=659016 RepID=A0A853FBL8_9BURK|nr:ABC transporter substrate-binding protein [Allopusillimonas soli]NYT35941.1 ABC transporter substrate-binding protein [Allopusillimonas soli]TEA76293.1 ABC transporter substrate-binding protein [Allopusillimonas soli]
MRQPSRFILASGLLAAIGLSCAQLAVAGSLTVYTALEDDEISDYMAVAKKAMPDIDFHVLRLSTGDLAARLLAEGKSPRNDVIWGFAVTNMLDPRIRDNLQPYLPEAAKKLPDIYKGADGKWFAATGYMAAFCVNTERLKSKDLPMPKSWEDLTNPAYKGEIVMPSPAASGTGYLQIAAILQGMGDDKGWQLIKEINPNVAQYTSSGSRPCKMARTGEYAIGASFAFPAMQSIEQGFPVKMVIPSDWVGYELEASGIMASTQNLKDAKRFLDWTVSPDAAELYKKYKEIITIPGVEPSEQAVKAGLPDDVSKVLYPMDFEKSAKERADIIKKWQQVTAK